MSVREAVIPNPETEKYLPSSEPSLTRPETESPEAFHEPLPFRTVPRSGRISAFRRTDFYSGAHHKEWQPTPLIQRPLAEDGAPWIRTEQQATEWLSLFYDLVVVAVLTIFSSRHELGSTSDIPDFLGFFVIIYWIWVSQTHYDIRFQSDDLVNRLFKFLQICIFTYSGATSGNWNPTQILQMDPATTQGAINLDNYRSFNGVVISLIISRVLLAIQFGIVMIQARRIKRRAMHLSRTIMALTFSTLCAALALGLPATSPKLVTAQVALLYVGIAVEILDVFVQVVLSPHPPFDPVKLGQRYGAFTLIILGEGLISLTKAFTSSLSALSFASAATYVRVFLGISIIYLAWGFLFARFDQSEEPVQGRALSWTILHFPLAFGLLMLLAALVNIVLVSSVADATNIILAEYQHLYQIAQNGTELGTDDYTMINQHFRKLELQPDFVTEYLYIQGLFDSSNPADDPKLISAQYFAQVVWETNWLYGIKVPDAAARLYDVIDYQNTTWSGNLTLQKERNDEMISMLQEFISIPLNEAFAGILWLLPVSGCVLLLCAIRSMLWYRYSGAAHWILHAPQIIGGVCLGLLGCLDIGNRDVALVTSDPVHVDLDNVSPLYQILDEDIPLILIAGVYLVTYMGSVLVMLVIWRRRRSKTDSPIVPESESVGLDSPRELDA